MLSWKFEPISPKGIGLSTDVEDDWFLFDDKPVEPTKNVEPAIYEDHPTRAQVATKLLEELDEWIKEGKSLY